MTANIECPQPAYNKIINSGLEKRIFENKNKVVSVLLGAYILNEETDEVFERAKQYFNKIKLKNKISKLEGIYKDLIKFESELMNEEVGISIGNKQELLIKNPTLLAYIVLGEDILKFSDYDFYNRRQLEESISSFCLGERTDIMDWKGNYIWRNNGFKNTLSNSYHGDLWIFQADISGRETKKETLFGMEKEFDTFKKNPKKNIVNADRSDWAQFLLISLKYAESIGESRMPEIVCWRDVLKEVGSVGTNTAECEFGDSNRGLYPLMESNILAEGGNDGYPFHIIRSNYACYYPYVSKGNLSYLYEDSEGDITLPFKSEIFKEKKFSEFLKYSKDDLPDLLKGTYHLFARDRSMLPNIMDAFLSRNN